MSSRRPVRQLLVAVLLGVLVGGGLMAVTPAGAEVSQAAATSWKKVWKKELKPLAAKAFYTKSRANQTFATKAESAAGDAAANAATDSKLGGYYKKTESDAKYAGAGSSYTKAESDGRYAPYPKTIRGVFSARAYASAAGEFVDDSVSWGYTLAAAPTPVYVALGGSSPSCPGTAANPQAAAGFACFYELGTTGATAARDFFDPYLGGASPWGTSVRITSSAGTQFGVWGRWAVTPAAPVATSFAGPKAPTPPAGANTAGN